MYYLLLSCAFILSSLFLPFNATAYETETVRIKIAIDGDTVILEDGRRVRYLGINTPEWQEPFSIKAKRFNKELVNNRTAILEFDTQKVDGYKRLLAYVYVDNVMINSRLVEEGLAHVFLIPPNLKHSKRLLNLQKKAQKQEKGMWALYDKSIPLKITQLKPRYYKKGKWVSPYLRIANLSSHKLNIGGYSLSNRRGKKYTFPRFTIEPGYSFIISDGYGNDGFNQKGQLTVHWNDLPGAWNKKSGKAFLFNPSNELIGVYRYKSRRIFYSIKEKK